MATTKNNKTTSGAKAASKTTSSKKRSTTPTKPKMVVHLGVYAQRTGDNFDMLFIFRPKEVGLFKGTYMSFTFDAFHVSSIENVIDIGDVTFGVDELTLMTTSYSSDYDLEAVSEVKNHGKAISKIIHNEYEKIKELAIETVKERLSEGYDVEIVDDAANLRGSEIEKFFEILCLHILTKKQLTAVGYTLPKSFSNTNYGKEVMKFGDYLLRKITGKTSISVLEEKDDKKDKKKNKTKNADRKLKVLNTINDALLYANVSADDKFLHIKFCLTADFSDTDAVFEIDVNIHPELAPEVIILDMYFKIDALLKSINPEIEFPSPYTAYPCDRETLNDLTENIDIHPFMRKLMLHDINVSCVYYHLTKYLIGLLGWMNIDPQTGKVTLPASLQSAIIDNSFHSNLPKPIGIWIEETSLISK